MEHVIDVLDSTGHTETKFRPDVAASVAEAKALFERLRATGHMVYRVDPAAAGGTAGTVMHSFDETAEKMIAVPRVTAG